MEEQLISFETAKLAKEKGFELDKYLSINDENPKNLNSNYNPRDYQPWYFDLTQSLLQKWLRDREENIIIVIPMRDFHRNYNGWYYEVFTQLTKKDKPVLIISSDENFDTYEEALEKGLQEALKLI